MPETRRIVYAGTPDFAVPALEALIASGTRPVAVYTQPDRPAGRGRKLTPSPVKRVAEAAGLPVYQPVSLKNAQAQSELRALAPDLLVVVAYGLILPPSVLAVPRLGGLNLHASLLPRWRGAAPIQRAILAGDRETGVCLMRMEAGLDTGPVFACAHLPLDGRATAATVHDRLAEMGARLLVDRLPSILDGSLPAVAQAEGGVQYAAKIDKQEAWIDWSRSAVEIDRQVRAFDPWPVAQTRLDDRVLRIHGSRVQAPARDLPPSLPGTILDVQTDGVDVATGLGVLRLLQVQLPGRRPIPARAWAHAEDLAGQRFGSPP
jgi:methionyl-tRNA formyltransferase